MLADSLRLARAFASERAANLRDRATAGAAVRAAAAQEREYWRCHLVDLIVAERERLVVTKKSSIYTPIAVGGAATIWGFGRAARRSSKRLEPLLS